MKPDAEFYHKHQNDLKVKCQYAGCTKVLTLKSLNEH